MVKVHQFHEAAKEILYHAKLKLNSLYDQEENQIDELIIKQLFEPAEIALTNAIKSLPNDDNDTKLKWQGDLLADRVNVNNLLGNYITVIEDLDSLEQIVQNHRDILSISESRREAWLSCRFEARFGCCNTVIFIF